MRGRWISWGVFVLFLLVVLLSDRETVSVDSGSPQVVCLAIDGLDPVLLEQFIAEGFLPHFEGLVRERRLYPLETTMPAESPTAWSSFLTGKNPGQHGVFGFIHRDPTTYEVHYGASRIVPPQVTVSIGSWRLPLGAPYYLKRRVGEPFWGEIARQGYRVVAIKAPVEFPPCQDCGSILSGMGVPDLTGSYGESTLFTTRPERLREKPRSSRIVPVREENRRIETYLLGPPDTLRAGSPRIRIPFTVDLAPDDHALHLRLGDQQRVLLPGDWSDWIPLEFPVSLPIAPIRGMVKVFVRSIAPHFELYVSPINADPLQSVLPISEPPRFAPELARSIGRFYTQGMPADTSGLEDGVLDRDEFLQQNGEVVKERHRMLEAALRQTPGGFLFFYMSTVDQVCHVSWPPPPPPKLGGVLDPIRWSYLEADRALGTIREKCSPDTAIYVISDHGFGPYRKSFDLNRWLLEEGYLETEKGTDTISWRRTRAYAAGFCGLYLNRQGREGEGIVGSTNAKVLIEEIRSRLLDLRDPDSGEKILDRVYYGSRIYSGARAQEGPDLVLGFSRGFRGSETSALGKLGAKVLEPNRRLWTGTHLNAARSVPGVFLSNRKIESEGGIRLIDLAPTIQARFGVTTGDLTGRDLESAGLSGSR